MGFSAGIEAANDWLPPARKRWTEEDGRTMATAFAESGLSRAAFARRHGLHVERVQWWLRELRHRDDKQRPTGFAPVRLVERLPNRVGNIEIIVDRYVVRVGVGFCPEALRQVLAALTDVAC